jgi:hypothetical protein
MYGGSGGIDAMWRAGAAEHDRGEERYPYRTERSQDLNSLSLEALWKFAYDLWQLDRPSIYCRQGHDISCHEKWPIIKHEIVKNTPFDPNGISQMLDKIKETWGAEAKVAIDAFYSACQKDPEQGILSTPSSKDYHDNICDTLLELFKPDEDSAFL